jgi:hypothetical protein
VCETRAEVLGIKDGINGRVENTFSVLSELSVRHQWRFSHTVFSSRESERERERERESVRDERGVHSYNSCACSKKASISSSSRSSRHGSLLNGVCWALRHSESHRFALCHRHSVSLKDR